MTTNANAETVDSIPATRRVDILLAHYGASHTQATNELIHFIAIPAIMLSIVGLFCWVHPWLAYVFLAVSLVYYLRLSLVFTASMVLVSILLLWAVLAMGSWLLPLSVGIFVVAWIFQFIGHKLEGKKPSFFEDIQYLWVGPLFVLSKLFLKLGIKW